ncbi:GerMN domain-containing protein [Acinetobacter sp. CUI P1]|nr:GerMN domain-containing protein [Acinetobacter sp. CUI P1]
METSPIQQSNRATLDIHLPNSARLGSTGEDVALQVIQKTVFQFDEIKSLDLLVDGKAVESLMGHVELEHPIMKSKN